jgi:hypothetical protein
MKSDSFDNDNDFADEQDCHDDDPETTASGNKLVRKRYGRTVDDMRTDDPDVIGSMFSDSDVVEIRRVQQPPAELPRLTSPEIAKQQRDARLAAARESFDMKVLNEKPIEEPITALVVANDNVATFKEKEPCPLLEQLNRSVFEPDETKRRKFIGTFHYIRDLYDAAGADALGLATHRPGKPATADYDLDRTASGAVWYANGQTLDRKPRVYGKKNDEADAKRFDGRVRTAKRSVPLSNGFNVYGDDPFVQRRLDAQIDLEDMAAVVGPLWLPLLKAVCGNAGFTDIANGFGYKQPAVGSAFIKFALEIATKAIEAKRRAASFREYVQDHGLPVAARRYERALKGAQIAA